MGTIDDLKGISKEKEKIKEEDCFDIEINSSFAISNSTGAKSVVSIKNETERMWHDYLKDVAPSIRYQVLENGTNTITAKDGYNVDYREQVERVVFEFEGKKNMEIFYCLHIDTNHDDSIDWYAFMNVTLNLYNTRMKDIYELLYSALSGYV